MSQAAPKPPVQLSPDEFLNRVDQLTPRVAVFDCDGTLWSGDAGSSFMHWSIDTGLLSQEKIAWLNDRYAGYLRGAVSELAICGEMVQVYAGLRESELRQAAVTFFREHVEAHIFPTLRTVVQRLLEHGTELWAVSSTNNWVIEEGVRRFGIPADHVLAARVEITSGTITDKLLDVPTDEGKVTALRRAGVLTPDAVFGNSVHDAAMLAFGRVAFPVNPTPALATRAANEGWPVFHPPAAATPTDKHQP